MLNYQDHLTKFVILRPLKAKTAVAIVHKVLDIFLSFGAPSILQSDNGREFVNQVIEGLKVPVIIVTYTYHSLHILVFILIFKILKFIH